MTTDIQTKQYSNTMRYFSAAGTLRNLSEEEQVQLFSGAFTEHPALALKALFHSRDVRGGLGSRQPFRNILKWLANNHPEVVKKNLENIAEFGRWDDLYALIDTPLRTDALDLMKHQFDIDMTSDKPSLLGKWLKSENASSKDTKRYARITTKHFGLTERQYRKSLSILRAKIKIVETPVVEQRFSDIDYSTVPSQAMNRYKKVFGEKDNSRFREYIENVLGGVVKINAGTLYPNQIVGQILNSYDIDDLTKNALEAQWQSLPNHMPENSGNVMCVVDVSGSMQGTPMEVAIALGIYISERNTGLFKDHFITFSENPALEKVIGNNINDKVNNLRRADWGMSTNMEKVFKIILDTAIQNNLKQEDLPERLIIISDMRFDQATVCRDYHMGTQNSMKEVGDIYKDARENFELHGFEFPKVVFWNVNGNIESPVDYDQTGTMLVSGFSTSILSHVLQDSEFTPVSLMLEVLNKPRYNVVKI